jgi:CheY-like chemotaxis protein
MQRVIIVGSQLEARRQLASVLGELEIEIDEAADEAATLRLLRRGPCALVVVDANPPKLDGLHVLSAIRAMEPPERQVPVIFTLSVSSAAAARSAKALGVVSVHERPLDGSEMRGAARAALGIVDESGPPHGERRRSPPLRVPVRVQLGSGPTRELKTGDITPSGAFVLTGEAAEPGARGNLSLSCPNHPFKITVDCRVAAQETEPIGMAPGLYLRFDNIAAEARTHLLDAFTSPMLSLPGLLMASGDFSAKAYGDSRRIVVHLEGSADMLLTVDIGKLWKAAHDEALRSGVPELEVDFRDLEFMNSSCFKTIVNWLETLRETPPAKQYKVIFVLDRKQHWQMRTLRTLTSFAADLATVET